jgi:phage major head subunit gpT-like protein
MLISAPNLSYFFTTLETKFQLAYDTAESWHDQIATTYPVTSEAFVSGWIGMLDKMRVWRGARQVRTPAPQTYTATILPFELTESIDQFKLADDSYGIYYPLIQNMGTMTKKWPDYSIRDLIEAGGDFSGTIAQTGTDGVSHWNTAHPVDYWDAGKGTYCNDYGASGTSVGGVTVGGLFTTNSYATVWEDHANRKNESGEKMGVLPDMTMLPMQLAFPGKTILQSTMFAPPVMGGIGIGATGTANAPFVGAMDNPLRGSTDLMINPDLTSAVAWYMLTTKRAIKPFGWALRESASIITRQDPKDPVVFDTHQYLFGASGRAVPVWSLPWLSSRSGI